MSGESSQSDPSEDRGPQEIISFCLLAALVLVAVAGVFMTLDRSDGVGLIATAVALGFLYSGTRRS